MEIRVNEYVRTTDGIFKVTKIDGLYIYLDKQYFDNQYFDNQYQTMRDVTFKERIIKYSFNIKELIENKDIIKVKTKENAILMIGFDENTIDIKYKEIIEEIENGKYELLEILTHEQYERNCYRIN